MLRMGVVGLGYWGPNVLWAFAGLEGVNVLGVADSDPSRLDDMGWVPYRVTSPYELPADLDAVAICTPVETHAELVEWALREGMHVFVEKPLALSGHQARVLVEVAKEQGRILMVNHQMLYDPEVRRLQGLWRDSFFGEERYVELTRTNFGIVRDRENVLWSFGPHDLSLVLSLFGQMPDETVVYGWEYLRPGIVDRVEVMMKYDRVDVRMHLCWLDVRQQLFRVVGSRGVAVYDGTEGKTTHWSVAGAQTHDRWRRPSVEKERSRREKTEIRPLTWAAADFRDSVLSGGTPLSDGRHGADVVALLELLDGEMHLEREVSFDDSAV